MKNLSWITKEFIETIPKTDLHVHLDGSLRLSTLIELAKEQKVELPSYTEQGLRELVFKENYKNLAEYLHGFQYTCAVLRDKEALERVASELAWDNFNEGVYYIEPRFAPQLNAHRGLSLEEVLVSVNKGLEHAKSEINSQKAVKEGAIPPFHYGIIGCAMRKFDHRFSEYFKDFQKMHQYATPDELYTLASLALVRALVSIRDEKEIPIVAFDLAGEEAGYPAEIHIEAYQYAHKNFLRKTVHAGEAYGPPSIFQATTDLHADRIGHGTHLFATELISNLTPEKKKRYMEDLIKYIGEQRITMEVCLSCNLQTIPRIKNISEHPAKKMIENCISVSFCTDNRLVSHTTVSKEVELAFNAFDLSRKQLKDIILYGFKRSFFPGDYKEKRDYVYQVIDYYEKVEAKFKSAPQQ